MIKNIVIILFFNTLSLVVHAQTKAVQQWKDLEKRFLIYLQKEDFDKADLYLIKLQKIANSKFKAQDSLFALTVQYENNLQTSRKCYFELFKSMDKHISWLNNAQKKNTVLKFGHYNYLLFKANAAFNIADSYMYNKGIFCSAIKMPTNQSERFNLALSYFDSAVVYYQTLKDYLPSHPDMNNNMAVTLKMKGLLLGQMMGNLEGCIQNLEQSIIYKIDADTYRLLGVANGISGKHYKAIDYFEKALEVGGERQPAILYSLEVAYRQLAALAESEKEAIDYQSKADSYQIRWKSIDPNFNPNASN
jgi:hypothetical protein